MLSMKDITNALVKLKSGIMNQVVDREDFRELQKQVDGILDHQPDSFIAGLNSKIEETSAQLQAHVSALESIQIQNYRLENNFYEAERELVSVTTRMGLVEKTTSQWLAEFNDLTVNPEIIDTQKILKAIAGLNFNSYATQEQLEKNFSDLTETLSTVKRTEAQI